VVESSPVEIFCGRQMAESVKDRCDHVRSPNSCTRGQSCRCMLGGAVLLLLDLFFLRYWSPELVHFAHRATLREKFLASFLWRTDRRNLHASIWIFSRFSGIALKWSQFV
jgi:hypothetical protein